MKRTRKTYTIGALVDGFRWIEEENKGLHGLDGKLIIQPDFQRNYVYKENENEKERALIQSILADDMIGVIHFNQPAAGAFELLDGQQRITAIGRYTTGQFDVTHDEREQYFNGLDENLKQRILKYKIDAHIYEGTHEEIKRQFKKINIAGLALTEQEALNAVYSGPFVSEARTVFSDPNSNNLSVWKKYVKGDVNRQEILAVALSWVVGSSDPVEVGKYMAKHQRDTNITEMKNRFDGVIAWIEATFTKNYPEMRGIDWDSLYREYGKKHFNAVKIAAKVEELYNDDTCIRLSRRGIFEYVLGGCKKPELLHVRVFSDPQKRVQYKSQTDKAKLEGISNCPLCATSGNAKATTIYKAEEMEADHVTAWSKGGGTVAANCQMLCKTHNESKGNR